MQLSTSQFSSEANLATLLLAGLCPAGLPAAATTTGAGQDAFDFSQLLPSAGSLPTVGANPATPAATAPADAPPALPSAVAQEEVAVSPHHSTRVGFTRPERSQTDAAASEVGFEPERSRESESSPAQQNAMDPLALALLGGLIPVSAPVAIETEESVPEFSPVAAEGPEADDDQDAGAAFDTAEEKQPGVTGGNAPVPETTNRPFRFQTGAAPVDPAIGTGALPLEADEPARDLSRVTSSQVVATEGRPLAASTPAYAPESARPAPLAPPAQHAAAAIVATAAAVPGTRPDAVHRDTANIAVAGEKISSDRGVGSFASAKSFLSSSSKRLTSPQSDLGIGGAEMLASMSTTTLSHRASSSPLAMDLPAVPVADSAPTAPDFGSSAPEAAGSAQRAVEVVLNAAERVASREQSAVNLEFSVGGEDLSVRVELRANEVHATFRTDSAELRAALSHEWQSVTTGSGERGSRLATPVFTGSETNGFSASSGDTASQQRESGAQRSQEQAHLPSARFAPAGSHAAAPAPVATPRGWSANSLHLHTLA